MAMSQPVTHYNKLVMAQLFYQGHSSFRITSNDGYVCFIDPYAGVGYQTPADLVLITHEHYDHNDISLIVKKPTTIVIRAADALKNGVYQTFFEYGFHVQAVAAYNKHHKKEESVGYLVDVDGIRLYHTGDTGLIPEMSLLKDQKIDYALLPIDGFYTMTPEEASEAAKEIQAKHVIAMHTHVGRLFDITQAMKLNVANGILMRPNDSIVLERSNHE